MRTALAIALGAGVTAVAGVALVVPVVLAASSTLSGDALKDGISPVSCGDTTTITKLVTTSTPKVAGFTDTQVGNAAALIRAGQATKMPPRAWVIAIATALQESGLRNMANDNDDYPEVKRISTALPHDAVGHDHDSVGLIQQRPDEGDGTWGPVKDLMQPEIAGKKFYVALTDVPGWQDMTLTRAAQKVQHSAYPSAYAKWEDEAARLVDALSGGAAKTAATAATVGKCAADEPAKQVVTSGGWINPVDAPIGSGFGPRSGRLHAGVDLSTSRGKPIVAAAAGTVIKMECDKHEIGYNCNRDGSPSTPGCGWHLYIRHAGNVITHYCHMLRQPLVAVGDQVKAGQQVGVVGTSGHSSGPHLHFEVHLRGDSTNGGAINPVPFMKARGAPLGRKGGADA